MRMLLLIMCICCDYNVVHCHDDECNSVVSACRFPEATQDGSTPCDW